MQALILAGGLGERLRPLTLVNPKSMVRVVDGRPFLEHQLNLLKRKGFTDIVVSIGYLGGQIKSYFGDGSYLGLNVEYSMEQVEAGTGGGLILARPHLEQEFFIVNGDTYLDFDYRDMYREFRMSNKILMMAVCRAEDANCILAENGDLTGYGKGGHIRERYIDAGIWVTNQAIFEYLPSGGKCSLEGVPLLELISLCEVKTYISPRFYDIGTFSGLQRFEREINAIQKK